MTSKNKKNYLTLYSLQMGSVALLGIGLMAVTMTLSFFAISELSISMGVTNSVYLSYLFPLSFDMITIIAILTHLNNNIYGHYSDEPRVTQWSDYLRWAKWKAETGWINLVILSFSGLSIWFNALHSGVQSVPAQVMSAMPPVGLYIVVELLVVMARSALKRNDLVTTIDSLTLEKSELEEINSALLQEGERLGEEVKEETLTLSNLQSLQSQYTISLSNVEEAERKLALLREEAERLSNENRQVKSESRVISELTDLHKRWITTAVGSELLGAPLTIISQVTKVTPKTSKSDKDNGVEFVNGTMAMLKEISELMKEKK